jgi:hypothetical protein
MSREASCDETGKRQQRFHYRNEKQKQMRQRIVIVEAQESPHDFLSNFFSRRFDFCWTLFQAKSLPCFACHPPQKTDADHKPVRHKNAFALRHKKSFALAFFLQRGLCVRTRGHERTRVHGCACYGKSCMKVCVCACERIAVVK